jgi:hypothetical protein
LADKIQGTGRGILMLGLLGIAGGFIHGVTQHYILQISFQSLDFSNPHGKYLLFIQLN